MRKFGDDPNIRTKSLDLIERGLWSIGDVVNSVLAFHRMPADGRRLTAADLDDLRILIEPELARRQLTLLWQCEIDGTADIAATETRQIALNLLLNACEASPPGTKVGFRAWVEIGDGDPEGRRLLLQVGTTAQVSPRRSLRPSPKPMSANAANFRAALVSESFAISSSGWAVVSLREPTNAATTDRQFRHACLLERADGATHEVNASIETRTDRRPPVSAR